MMMLSRLLIFVSLCMCLFATQASAFTADSLVIRVDEAGDAGVEFHYTLDWFEHLIVFLHIVDPAEQFRAALQEYSGHEVTVAQVDERGASFTVKGFARVDGIDGAVQYRTPGLEFSAAREVLAQYWFAPFIRVDLTPAIAKVTFPDGAEYAFADAEKIPPLEHTIYPQVP
ncbi:MAG: hypothetical protein QHG99_02400 [Methanomicrobiales archaeon]|nr:hypothetical protein [Methanomicrobiales archaeon]